MKKILILALVLALPLGAHAFFGGLLNRNSPAVDAVVFVAGDALSALNPQEQVIALIERCVEPQPDGVCECVANAVVANMSHDQWRTFNNWVFNTRATVTTTQFVVANPWIIPKIATPFVRCSR